MMRTVRFSCAVLMIAGLALLIFSVYLDRTLPASSVIIFWLWQVPREHGVLALERMGEWYALAGAAGYLLVLLVQWLWSRANPHVPQATTVPLAVGGLADQEDQNEAEIEHKWSVLQEVQVATQVTSHILLDCPNCGQTVVVSLAIKQPWIVCPSCGIRSFLECGKLVLDAPGKSNGRQGVKWCEAALCAPKAKVRTEQPDERTSDAEKIGTPGRRSVRQPSSRTRDTRKKKKERILPLANRTKRCHGRKRRETPPPARTHERTKIEAPKPSTRTKKSSPIFVISLQSGSSGNCTYFEAGDVRLLFDAGIPPDRAAERLSTHGRDIRSVLALLISHEHTDHVTYASEYWMTFGIPIFITGKTLQAAMKKPSVMPFQLESLTHFRSGQRLCFGKAAVQTIRTPHDVVDGVAFVVEANGRRLGILTDLGHVFTGLEATISSLDAVVIESNYDPTMLQNGRYRKSVKARIQGGQGHLSNQESAGLLNSSGRFRLKWACLAHLSGNNNTPNLALETHRKILSFELPLFVAPRDGASPLLEM